MGKKHPTKMPFQSLPRELVGEILGLLPSKKDQSSSALVSTQFLALARPILFSSIRLPKVLLDHAFRSDISADTNPRDYKDFVSFLVSSPEISHHIRDLTLWEYALEDDSPDSIESYELGALSIELMDDILSNLPSLQSLWLHGVTFKISDTPVPYRHHSIDRLIITRPLGISDVMKPLAFFSHVRELSLLWVQDSGEPSASFEQTLQSHDLSQVFSDDLQVSEIRISSKEWDLELWAEMFLRTSTPKVLRSISIHCDMFSNGAHTSSKLFELMCKAAPTLTHITLGETQRKQFKLNGYVIAYNDPRCAYHHFDSEAMRTRLAPLTSLRSLTFEFKFYEPGRRFSNTPYPRAEVFARMVRLLAAFPPCVRRVTLSFAHPDPVFLSDSGVLYDDLRWGSWVWPDIDLRLLVPLLRRYERLEAVVFEGVERTTVEEKERILTDLPEFSKLIQFVG